MFPSYKLTVQDEMQLADSLLMNQAELYQVVIFQAISQDHGLPVAGLLLFPVDKSN